MQHSKKGVTLIEIICGLAVLAIAVVIGTQLFSTGAKAFANGAQLDAATQKIVNYYESGQDAPDTAEKRPFTLTFGDVTVSGETDTCTVEENEGKLRSSLTIYENSIG